MSAIPSAVPSTVPSAVKSAERAAGAPPVPRPSPATPTPQPPGEAAAATAAAGAARRALLSRSAWTVGSYGASLALRLGTNVVMTWLLAPEAIGVMVVVNSVRLGIELLTDVGIEQNIVHNPDGSKPDFVDTAWTLQILRGLLLTALFCAASEPLAQFFGVERGVFLLVSLAPLVNALHSTHLFILVKKLDVRARNLFELKAEAISFCVTVALVASHPTVMTLAEAVLCSLGIRSALSYRLPGPRHRLRLSGAYVREIFAFGKWIVVSSLVVYASMNVDRLFLAKSIPLTLLGIYGLARTIAELPPTLANRLSYQVLFPTLAAAKNEAAGGHLAALGRARRLFVLLAAPALGTAVAGADFAVHHVYDQRYGAAGGMLSVLLVGAWFAVLSNLNEAALLGLGKPSYNSLSNVVRLALLAVALPLGLDRFGISGALGAMVLSELARYLVVLFGQARVGLTFLRQDAAATAAFAATAAAWSWAHWWLGLPIGLSASFVSGLLSGWSA